MSLLRELISALTDSERSALESVLTGDASLGADVIRAHLRGDAEDTIAKKLKITDGTYTKTQSLAYTTVITSLAANVSTSFDRIQLVNILLARGLKQHAERLYGKLEDEFERKLEFRKLDVLYREGVRISNATGDVQLMKKVGDRMRKNSARIAAYNDLDADVSLLVLTILRSKKAVSPAQIRTVESTLARARKLGHPVLLQNALTCRYAVALGQQGNYDLAYELASELGENAERYAEALGEYGVGVSLHTYVHFISQFNYPGDPLKRIGVVEKFFTQYGGPFERTLLAFNAFSYFFHTGDMRRASEYAGKLEGYADTGYRFAALGAIARSMLAFAAGDYVALRTARAGFYGNEFHSDYLHHDVVLRILDILACIRENDMVAAESGVGALRKFSDRQIAPEHAEYRTLMRLTVNLVQTIVQGTQKQQRSLQRQLNEAKFHLRMADYLYRVLSSELKVIDSGN